MTALNKQSYLAHLRRSAVPHAADVVQVDVSVVLRYGNQSLSLRHRQPNNKHVLLNASPKLWTTKYVSMRICSWHDSCGTVRMALAHDSHHQQQMSAGTGGRWAFS